MCTGEGPVVHASTLDIDFGAIPVLEDVTKEINLSNESLIPAEFYCDMVSRTLDISCCEQRRSRLTDPDLSVSRPLFSHIYLFFASLPLGKM